MVRNGTKLSSLPQIPTPTLPPPPSEVSVPPAERGCHCGDVLPGLGTAAGTGTACVRVGPRFPLSCTCPLSVWADLSREGRGRVSPLP